MKKYIEAGIFTLCISLWIILITGCTSSNNVTGNNAAAPIQRNTFSNRSGFQNEFQNRSRNTNLSDEERQKLMQEREKSAIDACNGKADGDSCTIQNSVGEISGTCNMQQDNLICILTRNSNQPPFSR
jgi:hypothetical protein